MTDVTDVTDVTGSALLKCETIGYHDKVTRKLVVMRTR